MMIAIDEYYDFIDYGVCTVCFILFSFEMTMQCLVVDHYFLGFFFWVDLVSTTTILNDIGWIWELLNVMLKSGNKNATSFTALLKASKAAKIIKIIRVIRVIRILRLYR